MQSNDTVFTEYLRANSWWTLTGATPALRSPLPNVKAEANGTATIRPQHPGLNGSPTPENGLKFNVQTSATPSTTSNVGWNFPVDNSKFGEKTLTHNISGVPMSAPVALFYPATGFQHPSGGPAGFSRLYGDTAAGEITPTPNWFYYYDQLWKNPWNIEVHYLRFNGSGSLPLQEVVFAGDQAHGEMKSEDVSTTNARPSYLFARRAPSTAGGTPGPLERVGEEKVRGIDVYARSVTHESCHVLMGVAIHVGKNDADGHLIDADGNGYADVDNDDDGCPDAVERAVGLNTKVPDTTGWPSAYSPIGDEETVATMYEKGVVANTVQDWADDGLNHGRVPAPNRNQRVTSRIYFAYNEVALLYPDPHAALNAIVPARLKVATP